MPNFTLGIDVPSFDKTQFFPYFGGDYHGCFKTFEFDFAAPTGNQDTLINNVLKGDLVYSTTDSKVKKVEIETTNATLKDPSVILGFVCSVYSDDWHTLYDEGRDFTADGGKLIVFIGKEIDVYTNKINIHSQNAGSADTRITLDPAVHAAGSAVLEDFVRVSSKDTVNPTFVFK